MSSESEPLANYGSTGLVWFSLEFPPSIREDDHIAHAEDTPTPPPSTISLFEDVIDQYNLGGYPTIVYEPEEHVVRCSPNTTRKYDLSAPRGFRQHFKLGSSVQRLILDAADDPDFIRLVEEQLENENENPEILIAEGSRGVQEESDAFLLPWTPGWTYFVVQVNSDDEINDILQTLAKFGGVGRHFQFVGAVSELEPPHQCATSPDISPYEWVKMRRGPYTNDWGFVISVH
ncbi:hypothetical protein DL96DRAFT_1717980 [Flagelloscypha sp. PMI_526]|nr:hypothetical protein DL96DRAFT_1717980 [Flagelloscypha sp. PMI_526]